MECFLSCGRPALCITVYSMCHKLTVGPSQHVCVQSVALEHGWGAYVEFCEGRCSRLLLPRYSNVHSHVLMYMSAGTFQTY